MEQWPLSKQSLVSFQHQICLSRSNCQVHLKTRREQFTKEFLRSIFLHILPSLLQSFVWALTNTNSLKVRSHTTERKNSLTCVFALVSAVTHWPSGLAASFVADNGAKLSQEQPYPVADDSYHVYLQVRKATELRLMATGILAVRDVL